MPRKLKSEHVATTSLDPSRMWLDRVPFQMPIYFALALSVEQFDECLDHIKVPVRDRPAFLKNKTANATVWTFDHPSDNNEVHIVCIQPNEDPILVCGLLVHEAVHIWQHIEKRLGNFGEEGPAYHIQHISQQLFIAYGERRAELEAAKS